MNDVATALRLETAEIKALTARIRAACDELVEREIDRVAAVYDRQRDLGKLLPLKRMSDAEVIRTLTRAHKAAQKALASGHHSGDRNRVIALAAALRAEKTLTARPRHDDDGSD